MAKKPKKQTKKQNQTPKAYNTHGMLTEGIPRKNKFIPFLEY